MRTTHVWLVALVFLVLASDFADVVVEASRDSIKFVTCVSKQLTNPPCDNKTCEDACSKRTGQYKSGECVAEGCKCTFCVDHPPASHSNEKLGTN
ncbi:hypothetical protein VPH35_050860 [Triticum aestivum]